MGGTPMTCSSTMRRSMEWCLHMTAVSPHIRKLISSLLIHLIYVKLSNVFSGCNFKYLWSLTFTVYDKSNLESACFSSLHHPAVLVWPELVSQGPPGEGQLGGVPQEGGSCFPAGRGDWGQCHIQGPRGPGEWWALRGGEIHCSGSRGEGASHA